MRSTAPRPRCGGRYSTSAPTSRRRGTGPALPPPPDATIQLLRAGVRTQPHRHVHSTVYQVFRGRGATIVDGVRFAWERGDMLAVPPWAVHEHHAGDADALLFSITDAPVLSAL